MKRIIFFTMCLLFYFGTASMAATIYVKHNASGSNNGTSWANAYTSLTSALTSATAGDEIWVAAGTYKPSTGTGRGATFELPDSVAVYGGFAGTENVKALRDWVSNKTILSGEIGSLSTISDNAYHVVTAAGISHLARLDGFIIQDGYASGTTNPQKTGGGVFMDGSDLTIRNCTFRDNHSFGHGAGIFISTSKTRDLAMRDCSFHQNNSHGYRGGGFYLSDGKLSDVSNCNFTGNIASTGAGFHISDLADLDLIESCSVTGNQATGGAGVYVSYGNVDVKNCIFKKNTGTNGGGIYSREADLSIYNCRFDTNTVNNGSGIYNYLGTIETMNNCHFNGNKNGGGFYSRKIKGLIDSCTFIGNTGSNGGGFHVYTGRYRVKNCQFRYNSASTDGGAIYQTIASVQIENCSFDSNTVTGTSSRGGAIYAHSYVGFGSIKKIHNSTFKGNTAVHSGGAIHAPIHNMNISNCTFKGNEATTCPLNFGGGALFITGDTMSFSQCAFENNTADGTAAVSTGSYLRGGAVALQGKYININECRFVKNTLGNSHNGYRYGGALAIKGGTNTVVKNSAFLGNSTGTSQYSKGGAVYSYDEDIRIQNCVFSGNNASGSYSYGGACYVALPVIVHSTFANNSCFYTYSTLYVHGVNVGDTAKVISSLLWDNGATNSFGSVGAGFIAKNSLIQGGYTAGTNIINSNPFFKDGDGADNNPGNIDDDLRLRSGSPAIDSGWVDSAPTRDITSFLRDLRPDIGAYEFGAQKTLPPLGSSSNPGPGNGGGNPDPDPDPDPDPNPPVDTLIGFLLPDTLYACSPDTFFIPISTGDTLQHVIGFDFRLEYDTALLTPTGRISQIESNMIDTNYTDGEAFPPPGTNYVNVSLFLNGSGPSGACWNGIGNVVNVQFVKRNTLLDTSTLFRLKRVGVSYSDSTDILQGDTTLVSMVQGSDVFSSKIEHWQNDSLLRYDTTIPKQYNVTQIIGTTRGGTSLGSSYTTNVDGQFIHSMYNGKHVKIVRDIKGSSTDSAATDMLRVINGNDAFLTKKTVLEDTSGFLPTIFQMIAMDVNRDGFVGSGDISQINMRAVGKYPEFRQQESHHNSGQSKGIEAMDWIFIDSSTVHSNNRFQRSSNYPDADAFGGFFRDQVPVPPIVISLPVIGSGSCPKVLPENYIGILYGDVDGNWDTDTAHMSAFKKSSDLLVLTLDSSNVLEGKEVCSYAVPVSIESNDLVTSVDFDIVCTNPYLSIDRIETHRSGISSLPNIKNHKRALFTSYYSKPGGTKGYSKEETLFTIHLTGTGHLEAGDLRVKRAFFNGESVNGTIAGTAECSIAPISIEEHTNVQGLSIFPNPTKDFITIELLDESAEGNIHCTLLDLQGRAIDQPFIVSQQGGSAVLDLTSLSAGTYMLKVTSGTNTWNQKVTKY